MSFAQIGQPRVRVTGCAGAGVEFEVLLRGDPHECTAMFAGRIGHRHTAPFAPLQRVQAQGNAAHMNAAARRLARAYCRHIRALIVPLFGEAETSAMEQDRSTADFQQHALRLVFDGTPVRIEGAQ